MCIEREISHLSPISLPQMDSVKLMNRTDRKYWFDREHLCELLERVSNDYYVLEIYSERLLPYSTTYYDTLSNEMFSEHHRGRMNRYKIRRRNYCATQSSFLEIKFKNNKGRTIKSRLPSDYYAPGFDIRDKEFIAQNSPYTYDRLYRVLRNSFRRITLVSKQMNERCTIDLDIGFNAGGKEWNLGKLAIVEIKSDGRVASAIIEALREMRIKPSGLSKYCIGRSLEQGGTIGKINAFKCKLRKINKIT